MKSMKTKKVLSGILAAAITAATTFTLSATAAEEILNTELNIKFDISKTSTAPIMDGKLEEGSYKKMDIKPGQLCYSGEENELKFMQTLPFEAYTSYDENNIYLLLSADASQFYYCDIAQDDEINIWSQSCMQFSVANEKASGEDRLEMGLARNSEDKRNISYVWAQSPDGKDWEAIDGQTFGIYYGGGRLNYEVAIGWDTFLKENAKTGDKIRFNFIIGYSDFGTRNFLEFSSGCAVDGKDASFFSVATLSTDTLAAVAAPVATETVAPVVEETTVAVAQVAPVEVVAAVTAPVVINAPITGDNTVLIVTIMFAVLAVGGSVAFAKGRVRR